LGSDGKLMESCLQGGRWGTLGGDGKLFALAAEGPGSAAVCCLRERVTLPPAGGSAGGSAASAGGSEPAFGLAAVFFPVAAFLTLGGAGSLASGSSLTFLRTDGGFGSWPGDPFWVLPLLLPAIP